MKLVTGPARRRLLVCLPALACALAVAACGSSNSSKSSSSSPSSSSGSSKAASSSSPFQVVMIADQSGPFAIYGKQAIISMKAGVAYMNEQGGILGHPMKLTLLDDHGDATTAVTVLAKYMSSHPKPNWIFPAVSSDATGTIPALKRYGVLGLAETDNNVCAAHAATTCPTVFTPGGSVTNNLLQAAQWFKQHHYKKVGILEEQEAFSETETKPLVAALKAQGIGSAIATFNPTAVDVKPQLQALKSKGADVLFVEALAAAPGYAATGRAALGMVDSMPMVFDIGASAVDLTKLVPAAALKNAFEQVARESDSHQTLPGRDLLLKYAQPFGAIDQPMIVASYPWTDILLLNNAAKQAKSIDNAKLIDALEHLSTAAQNDPLYVTNKQIVFTADVHENAAPSSVLVEGTVIVPVGPLKDGQVQY